RTRPIRPREARASSSNPNSRDSRGAGPVPAEIGSRRRRRDADGRDADQSSKRHAGDDVAVVRPAVPALLIPVLPVALVHVHVLVHVYVLLHHDLFVLALVLYLGDERGGGWQASRAKAGGSSSLGKRRQHDTNGAQRHERRAE